MKRSILLCCVIFLGFTNLIAQQYYMSTPQGFGAATTGGGSATPTTVSTHAALKAALTSTSAGVILVSGTIDFSTLGYIKVVVKNKTLIGLPGAKLVNTNQSVSGILYLSSGSTNVIIRNLIFEGPSAWDNNGNDNFTAECPKLWVDHCEFQDGEDGNFDIKAKGDNVTVSWCKFTYLKTPRPVGSGSGTTNDHRFSGLVGSGGSDAPTDLHFSITFQYCYWATGCKERMPRARNAELHILNCYYNTFASGTTAIGLGGGVNNSTCYVENTDFASIATPYKNYNSTDGGTHAINFTGCLSGGTNVGSVTAPSYTYTALPVAQVAAAVTNTSCGAGATLQVTSAGVISSSCSVATGVVSPSNSYSSVIYPNPSSQSFNVRGEKEIKTLSVVNLVGEELYKINDIQAGVDTEIAAEIKEGIYLIKIEYVSGAMEVLKFVKSK